MEVTIDERGYGRNERTIKKICCKKEVGQKEMPKNGNFVSVGDEKGTMALPVCILQEPAVLYLKGTQP
jgi:hypothetical protein